MFDPIWQTGKKIVNIGKTGLETVYSGIMFGFYTIVNNPNKADQYLQQCKKSFSEFINICPVICDIKTIIEGIYNGDIIAIVFGLLSLLLSLCTGGIGLKNFIQNFIENVILTGIQNVIQSLVKKLITNEKYRCVILNFISIDLINDLMQSDWKLSTIFTIIGIRIISKLLDYGIEMLLQTKTAVKCNKTFLNKIITLFDPSMNILNCDVQKSDNDDNSQYTYVIRIASKFISRGQTQRFFENILSLSFLDNNNFFKQIFDYIPIRFDILEVFEGSETGVTQPIGNTYPIVQRLHQWFCKNSLTNEGNGHDNGGLNEEEIESHLPLISRNGMSPEEIAAWQQHCGIEQNNRHFFHELTPEKQNEIAANKRFVAEHYNGDMPRAPLSQEQKRDIVQFDTNFHQVRN